MKIVRNHKKSNADINLLMYLINEKFRKGWKFIGIIPTEEDIGFPIGDKFIVMVYSCRYSSVVESDDDREKQELERGNTSIILFKGTDNFSYMRRIAKQKYDKLELEEFVLKETDLFYNS